MQPMKNPEEKITTGQVIGRLTVGDLVRFVQEHELFYSTPVSYLQQGKLREVTCSCGTMRLISESILISGRMKSCGCLRQEIRSRKAFQKLEKARLQGAKSAVANEIKIEQARLRALQLQPVPLRDEKAITECAAKLRSLFGQKGLIARKLKQGS